MVDIPWLTRLPTPEEVSAHAKAFPWKGCYFTWGNWLQLDFPDECAPVGRIRNLRVQKGIITADKHGLPAFSRSDGGSHFLPCTAEGIPVCFLEGK